MIDELRSNVSLIEKRPHQKHSSAEEEMEDGKGRGLMVVAEEEEIHLTCVLLFQVATQRNDSISCSL